MDNTGTHDHVFLGAGHAANERRTWGVIGLCTVMMIAEIAGGLQFGSIALVADGLHMSTHAAALLIAAMAYTYARRHATDRRFSFGTGKLGDLAGFTSAVILAMIAVLIGYEAAQRLVHPEPIAFGQAIPIAVLGLVVNVASAWLLSGGAHGHLHGHGHGHSHGHGHEADHHDDHHHDDHHHDDHHHDDHHDHHAAHHVDNNMRAALVHVVADAAVSVLVIIGLLAARSFGWQWIDPVVGLVGAVVIANWAYGLVRDTGSILLDMVPDRAVPDRVRRMLEADGDHLADLHVWRLGPGHLGVIVSVLTHHDRGAAFYRTRLQGIPTLSHITVEVSPHGSAPGHHLGGEAVFTA